MGFTELQEILNNSYGNNAERIVQITKMNNQLMQEIKYHNAIIKYLETLPYNEYLTDEQYYEIEKKIGHHINEFKGD